MISTLSPSQRAINLERRVKLFFFFSCLVLLFLVVSQVSNLLISFLLAFVTYFLLAPAVDYLERRGFSRVLATLVPFVLLTVLSISVLVIFIPDLAEQVKSLQSNSPKYMEATAKMISHVEEQVSGVANSVFQMDIQGQIQPQLLAWATAFLHQLPDYLSRSFTIMLLAPFLAFFMLLDGRNFVRSLIGMVPNNFFELVLSLNYQISSQIGGFIRARLIESVIVCFAIWGGLAIIHFPYALILAIFASILNIIPYLGPILGALPAFVISVAGGGSSSELLALTSIFVAVQVLDAAILVPFLVAKIVDLHPVTVVLAILIGSQVMGILGMIICIPVVSALKVTSAALYRHFTDFRT